MSAPTRRTLHLIPGERRVQDRIKSISTGITLHGYVGGLLLIEATCELVEFGRVIIKTRNPIDNNMPDSRNKIELKSATDLLLNGEWGTKVLRVESDFSFIELSYPNREYFLPLEDFLPTESFFRLDRLKSLWLNNEKDNYEVSSLFTDLSDHMSPISTTIHHGNAQTACSLNFDSKTKEFREIHLNLKDFNKAVPNDNVTITFNFLTIRYMFHTTIKEIDIDFGLFVLNLPSVLVAMTARQYDRRDCNLEVTISNHLGEKSNGTILNISPSGAEMRVEELMLAFGEEFQIFLPTNSNLTISAKVKGVRNKKVGMEFISPPETIRKIFNLSVNFPFVLRDSKNQKDFASLYTRVGYDKKVGDYDRAIYTHNEWQEKTCKIWEAQDSIFPGNNLGVYDGSTLISSFGMLPISEKVAYAHSYAMEKGLASIASCFDALMFNVASTELIPSIRYFLGSGSTESTFTTRLFSAFKACPAPDRQHFLYSLRLSNGKEDTKNLMGSKYLIMEDDDIISTVPEQYKIFFENFNHPHPDLVHIHEVKHFKITDSETEKNIGYVIAHQAPEFMTAANFFRIAWCFLDNETVDLEKVYRTLHANSFIQPLQINFFFPDLLSPKQRLSSNRNQDTIQWALIDKEEMGPVCASIGRTVYAVLKKYGNSAQEYLERIVG
jgi:hypothetical protein